MLDLWEIREGDTVTITNRIEDVRLWFELHPAEVSGVAECSKMQRKLESGYRPGEPMTGPNLWRVPTGDRIVRVRTRASQADYQSLTVIEFDSDALVFGERGVHPNDIAWFLSFGAPLERTPSKELARFLLAGIEAVRELGMPESWRISVSGVSALRIHKLVRRAEKLSPVQLPAC